MSLGRRTFLALTTATLWPRFARGQPARPLPRIGWFSTDREPDPFLDGFREGLRRHGYVEGEHVVLELRYGSVDSLRAAVADVKSRVAFVVAAGPAVRALRGTGDVAVLFAISGDPIAAGLATSLANPGRNFTGITFLSLEVAAQALGLTLTYVAFTGATELEQGFRAVRAARPDAMIVFPEGATVANRAKVAEFAVAQRLPAMFGWSEYVDAGGLMSYGANVRDAYVHLGRYADRLLHGAKPADLPIVQPTDFELVVNVRTAKLLDVTIPPAIAMRATRLIE